MTAPAFRCTADEPPAKPGGMYGPQHRLDSSEGLILDEFVLGDVVHLEHLHDRPDCYSLTVGTHRFVITHRRKVWLVQHEAEL